MRQWLEYAAAWTGLKALGLLPRSTARQVGAAFAALAYQVRTPLRRAAMFNLQLAFPDMSEAERKRIVRGMVRQIGWMAGEFSQFPKYTAANISQIVTIDGAKNFECAQRRGKGVLFLTGHMSAWELALFGKCSAKAARWAYWLTPTRPSTKESSWIFSADWHAPRQALPESPYAQMPPLFLDF